MRDVIANWQGTDAELLTALNLKQFKRKVGDGMVTLAMIAAVDPSLSALVGFRIEQLIPQMPTATEQQQADKRQVEKFLFRLEGSDLGLDFNNDAIREQFTLLLTATGFTAEQIDIVLGVGAVYESHAIRALGRAAIQSDVDAVRHDIWVTGLQTKANHAVALFIDAAREAGKQWSAEEQADQLLAAWEEA